MWCHFYIGPSTFKNCNLHLHPQLLPLAINNSPKNDSVNILDKKTDIIVNL